MSVPSGQDAQPCKACGRPTKTFCGYCRRGDATDECRKGYRRAWYANGGSTGGSWTGTSLGRTSYIDEYAASRGTDGRFA